MFAAVTDVNTESHKRSWDKAHSGYAKNHAIDDDNPDDVDSKKTTHLSEDAIKKQEEAW